MGVTKKTVQLHCDVCGKKSKKETNIQKIKENLLKQSWKIISNEGKADKFICPMCQK